MKAIRIANYGSAEVMLWREIPVPVPGESQLCVKIKAVSINPVDWKIRNGEMKLFTGKTFPKGMGVDFSGIVENCGSMVTSFKIGDEVFGWIPYKNSNSMAEYALVDENLTVKKPAKISFIEAAALPMSGVAAINALVDHGKITRGMNVLVNGCTGGVGQFAVMIAKLYGATVYGTCNTNSISNAKNLGADEVIDYTEVNVLHCGKKFDIIFDTAGKLSLPDCKPIMQTKSIFLELNVTPANLFFGPVKNVFSTKKVKSVITKVTYAHLKQLALWATEGKIKPVIGKQYNLKDALIAIKNMENGERNIGKTVLVSE